MFAALYGAVKKVQRRKQVSKVGRVVFYYPDKKCKQGIEFDHYCTKCGACGRQFDETGELIKRRIHLW